MSMKKSILYILFLLILITSCSKSIVRTYSVSGNVNDNLNGMYIELYEMDNNADILKSIDTITQGSFMLSDTTSANRKINIYLKGNNIVSDIPLSIWVGPEKNARIKGDSDIIINWDVDSDVEHQTDLNIYRELIRDLAYRDIEVLRQETEYMNRIDSSDSKEDSEIDTIMLKLDSLQLITDSVFDMIQRRTIEFMKSAPVTYTWKEKLALYTALLKYDDKYRPELENLVERIEESEMEETIVKDIMANLLMMPTAGSGEFMIDGTLYDMQGNEVKISDYMDNNIVLIFSKCDSIGESGLLNEIAEIENMKSQSPVTILNISLDSDSLWHDCVNKSGVAGVSLNQLRNGLPGLETQYRVKQTPFFVFITPEGIIAETWHGFTPGSLKAHIEAIIKNR